MTGAGACPWRLVPLLALWPVSTWSAPSAGNGAAVDEVRITARRDALQESRGAVAQKMVVERGELEAMGVLTVGEALKKLPGIDGGVSSGDGVPTANARGKTTYSAKLALGRRDAAAKPSILLENLHRRDLVDAYWLYRHSPVLNLRLSLQNLLGEGPHRSGLAQAGSASWRMASWERGERAWLLSLEGQW